MLLWCKHEGIDIALDSRRFTQIVTHQFTSSVVRVESHGAEEEGREGKVGGESGEEEEWK